MLKVRKFIFRSISFLTAFQNLIIIKKNEKIIKLINAFELLNWNIDVKMFDSFSLRSTESHLQRSLPLFHLGLALISFEIHWNISLNSPHFFFCLAIITKNPSDIIFRIKWNSKINEFHTWCSNYHITLKFKSWFLLTCIYKS